MKGSCPRPPRSRRPAWVLGAAILLAAGCSDGGAPTAPAAEPTPQRTVEALGGDGQVIWSGRRSNEPFAVRVTDATGLPVAGARVSFSLQGDGGGMLSQPLAITDDQGRAETFLLDAAIGEGTLRASSGTGSATFGFRVLAAPGEIVFEEGTGEVGLTGFPHPDSVVVARVLDTEGAPLEGVEVWFSAQGTLARWVDTTDASGHVGTVLRESYLEASQGYVWAFILGFPEVTTNVIRAVEPPARRTILISVDGLRGDAVLAPGLETFQRLRQEGAWTDRARTVAPSLAVPTHLSMLSGVPPEEHGVFQDVLEFTQEMVDLEPLFRRTRNRGREGFAFLSGEGPLSGFEAALECKVAFGLDSLELVPPSAHAAVDAALATLEDPEVELVFLHFPDPDLAGHAFGWSSPEYRTAVAEVDRALGRVLRALEPQRDSILLMVTADHGGGGAYGDFLHGSESDEDMQIPLLLWGHRVQPGLDLGEASILDVAPTALWSIGLRPPFHYRGEPLLRGFR